MPFDLNRGQVDVQRMTTTLEDIAGQISAGKTQEALVALDSFSGTDEEQNEAMFLRGCVKEYEFDRAGAYEAFEAVWEKDPEHARSMFRAAVLCEQCGDDEKALELYEQCTAGTRVPVNALINLAMLYEESGELADAENCLLDVLDEHPNHWRADHFLRSVDSSYTMVYDEHSQRERERRSAVLDVPISDFELSVRSRNCLRQMNIRNLGDLLKISESELLSYKNFGETSLNEIKAMLTQKGLRLGQGLQQQPVELPVSDSEPEPASSSELSQGSRLVGELELSVRSRKALQRLGISTLGDLAQRSEAELVTIKNFGQTSLNEIKRALAIHGFSLREPGA